MKTIRKILGLIVGIITILGVSGYVYFDQKFTPPSNYLTLKGKTQEIPIKWVANEISDISAMLLPVYIEGIPQKFYMQFDLGSPNTIFYSTTLKSIQLQYPKKINTNEKENTISLKLNLDQMEISSSEFRLKYFGKGINWNDENAKNIIGTIGTDLLEKRTAILNLKDGKCMFLNNYSKAELAGFSDFQFNKRRILLPAKIDNKELNLLYDSGTSAFELVTSKKSWDLYGKKDGKVSISKGNSWGSTLLVKTKTANKTMSIGNNMLKLSEVTYIEGTSTTQNMLMRLSGMEGLIGNKLFINHKLILDCANEKFKVE